MRSVRRRKTQRGGPQELPQRGHRRAQPQERYCLIDRANREILEIGSRLFPKSQTKKGHVSLAVIRRGFAVTLDILKARGMIGRRIARGLTGPDSMSAAAGFINCNLNGR